MSGLRPRTGLLPAQAGQLLIRKTYFQYYSERPAYGGRFLKEETAAVTFTISQLR